jgi:hypothetical protein
VPGSAPELAVGDSFEPQVFLLLDDFTDGVILEAAKVGRADAAIFFIFAGLQQFWRTEQAANVVGAKGWSLGLNHRIQLTQNCRRVLARR